MKVAILADPPDLSSYGLEVFRTWGLAACALVGPDEVRELDVTGSPVLVCPSSSPGDDAGTTAHVVEYARRGGTVVCLVPRGDLARATGLDPRGSAEGFLRLRLTGPPAAGLAGEIVPLPGPIGVYGSAPGATVEAWISVSGDGSAEVPALVRTGVGSGWMVAFCFDLLGCVLRLRQGDPNRAEAIPPGDTCGRPSHLAVDLGPHEAGWVPYADLLGRLLVDISHRALGAPVPLLWHLPDAAPGIILFSGDEDNAEISWNDEELDSVASAGGRMSLYVIPTRTRSTRSDILRYAAHHDVGPHPDLRPLDGEPLTARLEELERQILLFGERYGIQPRTLRNHSTVWPGYLHPVEVMQRLGVRMEGNYFSGTFLRGRDPAPYTAFGAAMPMRFCTPEGGVLDMFQQHTQHADDVYFGDTEYSYHYSPEQYRPILDRMLTDICTRFHTPYAVCIHPSNWVRFSRPHGRELLRQAGERGLPIWSFDQWSSFCDARSGWTVEDLEWDGAQLECLLAGEHPVQALSIALPARYGDAPLGAVLVDGERVPVEIAPRYGGPTAFVRMGSGATQARLSATYGGSE